MTGYTSDTRDGVITIYRPTGEPVFRLRSRYDRKLAAQLMANLNDPDYEPGP